MSIVLKAWDGTRSQLRAQRNHEGVCADDLISHGRSAPVRVYACDRISHYANAEAAEAVKWTLPLLQSGFPDQCPRLAEAHHKMIASIHEYHFIFGIKFFFQSPRGGNSTEPTA
jgi:hypothetical protein